MASLLEKTNADNAQRIDRAYLTILNRSATAEEIESGGAYLERFARDNPGALAARDAWESLCKILIASNEFIYVD